LAKQEVISVPVKADNSEQTIVNPPHPDIVRETQPLPNLVVATLTPAPPTAALTSTHVTLPQFLIKPVQPPPDVRRTVRAVLPKVEVPEAVQPAITADDLRIKSEIKSLVAKMEPKVEAPKVAEPEPASAAAAPPEPVPSQPSTQGLASDQKAAGQLIVLNVRPVAPPAEIKIPNGSRAGVFAATPTGKAGAPGTPDIQAAPAETNAVDANGRNSSAGNGEAAAIPAGISVSGIPLNLRAGALVAVPNALPPKPAENRATTADAPKRTFAMASADVRRTLPPYVSNPERKPEETVFAGKKYYSMQLNMPNLVSAGGSWIIRFAELKENSGDGELSTPVVTEKIDPAYPADLIRDQVEGVVILYAVIHADGTVGDVRVLQSLHESLDANACRALGRWHFRPATKNGVPVELEAVVRIPFKARKVGF
jgi:TonB family protein